MTVLLTFLIVGLATGSVYGLAGMGLVLTYKTSGVFNFAHGAVGAVGAYAFWEFRENTMHLPWPLAALAAIVVAGPILGLIIERVAGGLGAVSSSMKIVATVGMLLAIQGGLTIRYGGAARYFQAFLPTNSIRLAGVNVGTDQLVIIAFAALTAAGLAAFFRASRLGAEMRAVVDNEELMNLAGANPVRVRRAAWMIGCTFAALSGILLAPQLGLQPALLTLLVVQAFGGAAIGRFTSLPLTYVGGVVVGVAAAFATRYVPQFPKLAGVPASLPFIVLFVALLFFRESKVPDRIRGVRFSSALGATSAPVRVGGIVVASAALLLVPTFVGTRLPVYTNALVYGVLFMSLGFLVRTSGQTSLCHAGFAAVGAATFGHALDAGLPWPVALVAAAVVTGVVGTVLALPAIRLSGLYLALATFGFGVLLQKLAYTTFVMFGRDTINVHRPELASISLSSDRGYYYVVLFVAALSAVVVVGVQRSRLGRLLRAMADSPVALVTFGTSVQLIRILAFSVSAAVAGIAGALLGGLVGSVNGSTFDPFVSLLILAVLAIAGPGTIRSALAGAIGYAVVPAYINNPHLSDWLTVVFGASALVVALASGFTAGGRFGPRLAGAAERARARATRSPVAARRPQPTDVQVPA